jgi:bacterial/archaeal transporter family protein
MAISLGVIFGLISMVGFGLSNAISKIPSTKIGSRRTIFYRNAIMSLVLFIILLFFISESVFSLPYVIYVVIIAFIGYFQLALRLKAVQYEKVGLVTSVSKVSIIIAVLLSVIFYNERLSLLKILAIILVTIGILGISLKINEIRRLRFVLNSKAILLALISAIMGGFTIFLFKVPIMVIGPFLAAFLLEFFIFTFSFTHLKLTKSVIKFPSKKVFYSIIIMSLLGVVGMLFMTMGLKVTDVTIVVSLSLASPFVTTLYGRLVFKEKLNFIQYVSMIFIFMGVIIVSVL